MLDFDGPRDEVTPATADGAALVVDVAGFEGPLDLLLHLARRQKVDLSRVSILDLARQYLAFVEGARLGRLDLAADYLVMAAWLAYLKSKLLLPPKAGIDEEGNGEEMAAVLQRRLQRLEAVRDAASRLVNRDQLGRNVFARGMPEPVAPQRPSSFSASLYDLLTAYATQHQRQTVRQIRIEPRSVWSLVKARELLVCLLGELPEWSELETYLLASISRPDERRTIVASSFAASLELVREGRIEIRQDEAFAPLHLRLRDRAGETGYRP